MVYIPYLIGLHFHNILNFATTNEPEDNYEHPNKVCRPQDKTLAETSVLTCIITGWC